MEWEETQALSRKLALARVWPRFEGCQPNTVALAFFEKLADSGRVPIRTADAGSLLLFVPAWHGLPAFSGVFGSEDTLPKRDETRARPRRARSRPASGRHPSGSCRPTP